MAVCIDREKCIGCGKCCAVCPGNIIRKDKNGKAYIKDPGECWSCTSCMKECPVKAISLVIPPELGGRGGSLSLERSGSQTTWTATAADGKTQVIITDTKESNKY